MKLTPVKIRGKRGNSKAWRPPDPSRVTKKRTAAMAEDEASVSSIGDRDASRRTKRQKSRNAGAPIERLPNEILERIAVLSENLNFMRSSVRIGLRLSNASFRLELMISAFGPTWDQWFGITIEDVDVLESQGKFWPSVRIKERTKERVQGRPILQSDLLACPWADINFILQAQQVWYRQDGKRRAYQQTLGWWFLEKFDRIQQEYGGPVAPLRRFEVADDIPSYFETDWESFLVSFGANIDQYALSRRFSEPDPDKPGVGYVDVHPRVKIPHTILGGPPDWDKAKLLFWLIRGGASLHPDQTYELTSAGFDQIMIKGRSKNADDRFLAAVMLYLFTALGVFHRQWPSFLMPDKQREFEDTTKGIDLFAAHITDLGPFLGWGPPRTMDGIDPSIAHNKYIVLGPAN